MSARAKEHRAQFNNALSDNLNTPRALAELHTVIKSPAIPLKEKYALLVEFENVCALNLESQSYAIPQEVQDLLAQREQARRSKQFIQSDALRDQIDALGYRIDDTPEGPVVLPK